MMVALNYQKKHIKKHPTTRSGIKLLRVQAGIDHYTANPGADADNHFTYFDKTLPNLNDGLPEKKKRYASAHIFVDRYKALELVPLDEVCFHANDGGTAGLKLSTLKATSPQYRGGNANLLTIGIEMCLEPDGTIHPDTIKRTALVHQMLQKKFPQLKDTYNRFVRHYDVTGKNCPAPMVKDPSLYKKLLDMTDGKIKINPKVETQQKEEDKVKKAIVINSESDYNNAVLLAHKLNCSIYTGKEDFNSSGDKVEHLYVVGGNKDGLKADKITLITGADRNKTSIALDKYL